MSQEPLTENEKLILNLLKERSYGFNELCNALKDHISRPTVRKDLNHLIRMQLVYEKKGRRGQRASYISTETLTRFEEKVKRLETHWEDLFYKLDYLERRVEDGIVDLEEAGSRLVWLIFYALPLLPIGLIDVKSFSIDARRRLYDLSREKFNDFWETILRLGHKHPKLSQGFRKGCEDLNEYVKPAVEAVEDWFKKLAELEQHESK